MVTRAARLASAGAALALLLVGCSAGPAPTDPAAAPAEVVEGPRLVANGEVFDPVVHDVEGVSVCDGEPGRTVLEEFDRAAWEAFDLAEGDALMTCGHPDGAGWLHIADGHTDDYGEIAELVGSSWEDVAWFAIDHALQQPAEVEQYDADIANYLVLLEYIGDSGEVEQSWSVVVGVGLTSGKIITSFPRVHR